MKARSFSHVGITVSDFNKAVRFYWDVFGCPLVGVADTPPERVRSFFKVEGLFDMAQGGPQPSCKIGWIRVPGGAVLEIFEFQPQLSPSAIPWNKVGLTHISFNVRNLQGWHDYLVSQGVECVSKPERSPRGHSFFFAKDFDGNLIELMDLGYMYYVLAWLGPLGGWIFRRGVYKSITKVLLKPVARPSVRFGRPCRDGPSLSVSNASCDDACSYPRLCCLLPAVLPRASWNPSSFDVVSIKPNRTNQGIPVVAFQPGGRMIAGTSSSVRSSWSHTALEDLQLVNAPDWTATERFAIEARTADDTPTNTIRLMLRSMLADRFGFAAHQERRELPIYALTMARPDKRLGARLQPSGPECAPVSTAGGRAHAYHRRHPRHRETVPVGFGSFFRPTNLSGSDAGPYRSGLALGAQHHDGGVHTAAVVASGSSSVVDETGLRGAFDLDVIFAPEGLGGALVGPPPAAVSDAPSLFTALQDDLG